jgi:LacI family transcriptional regulator
MGKSTNSTSVEPPRVNQRAIATRLGISAGTVSMALRNYPRIHPATRERVKRVAEEMGYQPEPILQGLVNYSRAKRQSAKFTRLAWVNTWPRPNELLEHPEYGAYWEGAQEAALAMGYQLIEFELGTKLTCAEFRRQLRKQGTGGLLLPPAGMPLPDDFPWDKYHVVCLSHRRGKSSNHFVTPDRVENVALAFSTMRQRGYRRIGFITDELPTTIDEKLSAIGFLNAQIELPEEDRLPIFTTREGTSADDLADWIKLHQPDAILSDLPEVTGLLKAAHIEVPHQVGLALSALPANAVESGVDPHGKEIGRAGIELLKGMLDGFVQPEIRLRISIKGCWCEGNTLPDRRI